MEKCSQLGWQGAERGEPWGCCCPCHGAGEGCTRHTVRTGISPLHGKLEHTSSSQNPRAAGGGFWFGQDWGRMD